MRPRIEFLDGLRAIAVLAVVAFHTAGHNPALIASTPESILAVLRQGCHGVDLFFVISGFCLSYPVLLRMRGAPPGKFDVCSFAARRTVRIVPPYYAAIGLLLILAVVLTKLHVPMPIGMPQHGFTAADVVKQGLFFDSDVRFLNDAFWTLAVEFRWYFIFPIALWLWLRSPKAFVVAAFAAVFAAAATRAQSVDLAVLPTFMLGIVAADLYLRDYALVRVLALPALAATLVAAFASSQTAHFEWSANPLWGLAAFCFVLSVSLLRPLRNLLSLKALTLIGFTSYGVYLVHEPFRALVQRGLSPYAGGWVLWIAGAVGAVVCGMLFSYVAERPFVSNPLRTRAVSSVEAALSRIFGRFGIAREVQLPASGQSAETVRAVA